LPINTFAFTTYCSQGGLKHSTST